MVNNGHQIRQLEIAPSGQSRDYLIKKITSEVLD